MGYTLDYSQILINSQIITNSHPQPYIQTPFNYYLLKYNSPINIVTSHKLLIYSLKWLFIEI